MSDLDNNHSIDCKKIISGEFLAKRPSKPLKVQLEKVDNKSLFSGVIELVSPIGIVLRSSVPLGKYKLKVFNNLEIIVKTVNLKESAPYQSFDIIKVIREKEERKKLSKEDFELLTYSSKELIAKLTEDLPKGNKELIREQLQLEVEKSELLDELEVADVFKYSQGKIKNLTGFGSITLSDDYLSSFIKRSIKDKRYTRETIIDESGERIYDLHALPMNCKSGGMIAIDVTDIINTEKKNKTRELEIYRDVIEAATNGKFKLIFKEEEINNELEKGNKLFTISLQEAKDIKASRARFKEELKRFNLTAKEKLHLTLALSEVTTNALKHGGTGELVVKNYDNNLRIITSDQGKGIDFKELPKAALMKNYSKSNSFSLGQGFSVMFMASDRLLLKTDCKGTIVILEKGLTKGGAVDE
ncbi:anti-sigma regulatory factor (Ser/Thr protein kinase) [Orenia metallireducens]|uniref:Anti-sigma regulatory factor (Ser/Thr protein kinase) n=1 Tax=Orenia metallireducens TaxID=1413210 RepID=A0A285ID96_9FIRM|nr:ATP-binding protein [Orenia metallireducens]PRX19638.1 anti-sigma regulatory factor (Ser/Thr protein kinase) [Orenia metallireducens]SNY45945.1 Anti-sigma regulatory factor (Ser/Thr protein kinase) [Orenia metallireducens]